MADISFDSSGKAYFTAKYHGRVTLSKQKWETICSEPERFYYKSNGEKIATTLINPDVIVYHRHFEKQLFYYKKFDKFRINDKTEFSPRCKYFAVIIDISTARICTVYPVEKPKEGKIFKSEV